MIILSLDCSSTAIGHVAYNGRLAGFGTELLSSKLPIGGRIHLAEVCFKRLIHQYGPHLIAVEGPAYGGWELEAILMVVSPLYKLAYEQDIELIKVAPATAKKRLTGNGRADKAAMVAAARQAFGLPEGDITKSFIKAHEHIADAYAVLLVAQDRLEERKAA